ncbi:MAG: peptide deformylase [Phascolarctobacterium sp.]|nr:peptide deformylase [Phascolarctobacterium sp.]
MATLKILTAGDPFLRKIAQPVERIDKKLLRLIKDMQETMYEADGVGLAAPQIGISKRLVVIDVGEENGGSFVLINPEIIKKEGSVVSGEGCLSVPDFEGDVERAEYIECEFTSPNGKRLLLQAHGLLAVCIQHECDHLEGILFIDKAQSLSRKEAKDDTIEKFAAKQKHKRGRK